MKELLFEQFLPITLETAWTFFSNPGNLNLITPDKMHFTTLTKVPDKMHEGLVIKYKIRPMLQIPINWETHIVSVREMESFSDMQMKGPYKVWIHQHNFKTVEGGVLMTDKLTYDIGMGPLGWLAGKLWVDKQVSGIFEYREKKLLEIFP
ncbi:MAG: SRPBCC family protein [Bacteroidota bacterium]|nr:SRPBCC family protein [Bacteroidota bacterium]